MDVIKVCVVILAAVSVEPPTGTAEAVVLRESAEVVRDVEGSHHTLGRGVELTESTAVRGRRPTPSNPCGSG